MKNVEKHGCIITVSNMYLKVETHMYFGIISVLPTERHGRGYNHVSNIFI